MHLLDAVDLLFERRRDGGLDVGGAGADERRGDLHHRRDDLGILRDRQAAHRDEAEQDHDDREHHRDDRPVDEETGHGYFASPAGLGRRCGRSAAGAAAIGLVARSCRR